MCREFDAIESFGDGPRIFLALRRQPGVPLATDEQAEAKEGLELGNMPAHRPLGDVEPFGSLREVLGAGGGLEDAKRV